ncbi:hypothetical protein DFA_04959 [Cavenderia fasciculata]|uniref:Uncharacterized protein n=1 Tax=Cavenderia fasciculata TaxID=261658 RepID=F4PMN2_CACFS|nr:uncharacterized protein DFA_04959 [Cavenderia fasciculata]EGG22829.1 hypothetical protein DFA_04959 [Cavenderia fasciculata]|eukprot:XP_004360680.1 hypothetical protein DFA_04959 [Cavenderia fasciculata]
MDLDLRDQLFVAALQCGNNQEIIKWLKDSFTDLEELDKFCKSHYNYITKHASTDTINLIKFKLTHIIHIKELCSMAILKLYLPFCGPRFLPTLQRHMNQALSDGDLEFVDYLLTAESDKKGLLASYYPITEIDPSIMSMDLVNRLKKSRSLCVSKQAMTQSAISAKQLDVLQYIIANTSWSTDHEDSFNTESLVVRALCIDDTSIIAFILDRFYHVNDGGDEHKKAFKVTPYDLCNMEPRTLEYLYLKGHFLEFEISSQSQTQYTYLGIFHKNYTDR